MTTQIKQIKNSKDLEGLAILDNVEITYSPFQDSNDEKYCDSGIYAGRFNKKHEHYIVLSNSEEVRHEADLLFVKSKLYLINDTSVVDEGDTLCGYCHKDKLKDKLQDHLTDLRG